MQVLSLSEIENYLATLSNWHHVENVIMRQYEFKNFDMAMEFVNKVAQLANALDHHPDIRIYSWNKVEIKCSTHAAGGLTEKDFQLATEIETCYKLNLTGNC